MKKILLVVALCVSVAQSQNITLDAVKLDTLRPKNDAQTYFPRKTKIDSLNVNGVLPVGAVKNSIDSSRAGQGDFSTFDSLKSGTGTAFLSSVVGHTILNPTGLGRNHTVAGLDFTAIGSYVRAITQIGGAAGNGIVARANDAFPRGNNNATAPMFNVSSYGADALHGLGGNLAFVIVSDTTYRSDGSSDVRGYFYAPTYKDSTAWVRATYAHYPDSAAHDAELVATDTAVYSYDIPAGTSNYKFALSNGAAFLKSGSGESQFYRMKVRHMTYSAGTGTKIWFDSVALPYATISQVVSNYAPTVFAYKQQMGNAPDVAGKSNSGVGYGSQTGGLNNLTRGTGSVNFGTNNRALGDISTTIGQGLIADGYGEFWLGRFNARTRALPYVQSASGILLGIGIGNDAGSRANGFTFDLLGDFKTYRNIHIGGLGTSGRLHIKAQSANTVSMDYGFLHWEIGGDTVGQLRSGTQGNINLDLDSAGTIRNRLSIQRTTGAVQLTSNAATGAFAEKVVLQLEGNGFFLPTRMDSVTAYTLVGNPEVGSTTFCTDCHGNDTQTGVTITWTAWGWKKNW